MATLQKHGSKFRLAFHFGGKRIRFALKTGDEKEAEAAKFRVEENILLLERGRLELPADADLATFLLSDGKIGQPPSLARSLTLRELSERYQEAVRIGALEANTRYTIAIHLRKIVASLGASFRLASLTGETLQKHINLRAECKGRHGRRLSAYTLRKEIVTLGAAFNWAVSNGLHSGAFPKDGLKYPRLAEKPPFRTWSEIQAIVDRGGLSPVEIEELWGSLFLSAGETALLIEHARSEGTQPWVHPMVATAAHTGMRRSELVRLQVSDVRFENESIHVSEKKRVKGRSSYRTVPISPLLADILKDWIGRHPGGNALFCQSPAVVRSKTQRGQALPVTAHEAHDHFHRTMAGSKWSILKGWHTLRHSFASNCAAAGVPEYLVSGWMGHQTQEMVQRYRHLFPSKQKQAIASVFGGG